MMRCILKNLEILILASLLFVQGEARCASQSWNSINGTVSTEWCNTLCLIDESKCQSDCTCVVETDASECSYFIAIWPPADDVWCNLNCKHVSSFCPKDVCRCADNYDYSPPMCTGVSIDHRATNTWCRNNCKRDHCPAEFCREKCQCPLCLERVLYRDCPSESERKSLPSCDSPLYYGDLCKGRGECETDRTLDNCGEDDVYRRCADNKYVSQTGSPAGRTTTTLTTTTLTTTSTTTTSTTTTIPTTTQSPTTAIPTTPSPATTSPTDFPTQSPTPAPTPSPATTSPTDFTTQSPTPAPTPSPATTSTTTTIPTTTQSPTPAPTPSPATTSPTDFPTQSPTPAPTPSPTNCNIENIEADTDVNRPPTQAHWGNNFFNDEANAFEKPAHIGTTALTCHNDGMQGQRRRRRRRCNGGWDKTSDRRRNSHGWWGDGRKGGCEHCTASAGNKLWDDKWGKKHGSSMGWIDDGKKRTYYGGVCKKFNYNGAYETQYDICYWRRSDGKEYWQKCCPGTCT